MYNQVVLLSQFPEGHELDRLPTGVSRVPLSTLNDVRAAPWDPALTREEADARAARRETPPVWLHSERPGRYELAEGEHRLMDARQSNSPSVALRLTRPSGWSSNAMRDPRVAPVALAAPPPPANGRLRPGEPAPVDARGLSARLLAPAQPHLARAASIAAGIPVRVLRGQMSASEGKTSDRRLRAAVELGLSGGAEALARAVTDGLVPEGWRSLGWLRESDRRAPRPAPPCAGAVVWASAAEPAVLFALWHLRRAAAALAPWGARVGPERALLVAPRAHLSAAAAFGLPVLSPEGGDVLGALRLSLETSMARFPMAQRAAAALAAPLEHDLMAWQVAYLGALWDAAVEAGMALPSGGRRYADMPHPCRSLAAVLASGLMPVMLDERGAVLGIPAAVTPPGAGVTR